MKPTPAKPRIIIAQVEGSGTAEMPIGAFALGEVETKRPALLPSRPEW